MNVEIGAEAALFPEKEYIDGIAVAVRSASLGSLVGRYNNPMSESTLSPNQGLKIWLPFKTLAS